MPRALQISGTAVPLASSASASRSLRMICSGEWRMRFIGSPPALSGENDSHIGWTSLWGAGQPPGALERRAGEGVEDATAVATSVVEHGGAVAAVDAHPVGLAAAGAGRPIGMEPGEELLVAGVLVHQLGDREVHGRPPPSGRGTRRQFSPPDDRGKVT